MVRSPAVGAASCSVYSSGIVAKTLHVSEQLSNCLRSDGALPLERSTTSLQDCVVTPWGAAMGPSWFLPVIVNSYEEIGDSLLSKNDY